MAGAFSHAGWLTVAKYQAVGKQNLSLFAKMPESGTKFFEMTIEFYRSAMKFVEMPQ